MTLREILIKKLEYQIFAWQKEIEKSRTTAHHSSKSEKDPYAVAKIDEDPQAYIQRMERNLEAARKKIEEVRQADEKRLMVLKKQLSDWMDTTASP